MLVVAPLSTALLNTSTKWTRLLVLLLLLLLLVVDVNTDVVSEDGKGIGILGSAVEAVAFVLFFVLFPSSSEEVTD